MERESEAGGPLGRTSEVTDVHRQGTRPRCLVATGNDNGEKFRAQTRRRRPGPRASTTMYVLYKEYGRVLRTRPNVPWDRTRPLIIAEAAIALARALRRVVRLFMTANLNMVGIKGDSVSPE